MSSDVDHEPSYDTHLARLLHERGRVDVQVLQGLLAKARVARDIDPSLSLALSLVQANVLTREEADAYLAELEPSALPQANASSSSAGEARAARWRPGGRIDRYEILKELGRGGMGTVFLAQRDGEQVAIKVLPLEIDEDLQARFQREYDAQSAINPHPNVLRVRGAGVGAGARYLVLDLATGGDLQERLRQGPLPLQEVVDLGRQLARGLAHVHAHGILHRDLKPGNVLLDADGTPKLVDFGLARSTIRSDSSLTHTGELLGTPSYMAPEQATGVRGEVGVESDVYGLGALLFHALTGRPPFVGASTLDVLTQVITSPPPRPSSVRSGIPPALDDAIQRALSKAPADRFPSAAAMADALEHLQPEQRKIPPALMVTALLSLLLAVLAIAASQGSAPPTQVASTASPLPRPSPIAPSRPNPVDPLAIWNPPIGLRLETVVTFKSTRTWRLGGIKADALGTNGVSSGRLKLRGRVLSSSPAKVVIEVEIAELRLRDDGNLRNDRFFDSRLPADRMKPFYAAIGMTFRFTMVPSTGEITQVVGLPAIQQAVSKAAPPDMNQLIAIEMFSSNQMFDLLNLIWNCLPDPRVSGRTWTVVPPAPRQLQTLLGYRTAAFASTSTERRGPPVGLDPIPRKVKLGNRAGETQALSWTAQKDARRTRARVVIAAGLVRDAEVSHTITFLGIHTRAGKKYTVEWVFASEYQANLIVIPE